ncbi:MAG: hypothetical protein WBV90_19330 [Terrimicrobiaceae bacterium]
MSTIQPIPSEEPWPGPEMVVELEQRERLHEHAGKGGADQETMRKPSPARAPGWCVTVAVRRRDIQ